MNEISAKKISVCLMLYLLCGFPVSYGMEVTNHEDVSAQQNDPYREIQKMIASLRVLADSLVTDFDYLKANITKYYPNERHNNSRNKQSQVDIEEPSRLNELLKKHYEGVIFNSRFDLLKIVSGDLHILNDHLEWLQVVQNVLRNTMQERDNPILLQKLQKEYVALYNLYAGLTGRGPHYYMPRAMISSYRRQEITDIRISFLASALILIRPLIEKLPMRTDYAAFLKRRKNALANEKGEDSDNLGVPKADPSDIKFNLEALAKEDVLRLLTEENQQDVQCDEIKRPKQPTAKKKNVLQEFAKTNPQMFVPIEPQPCKKSTTNLSGDSRRRYEDIHEEQEDDIDDVAEYIENKPTVKAKKTKPARVNVARRIMQNCPQQSCSKGKIKGALRTARSNATTAVTAISTSRNTHPVYLTKKAHETLELLFSRGQHRKVSEKNYKKLVATFIRLNWVPDGFLQGVTSLKGTENHSKAPQKASSPDKLSIGDGMSFYFTRHDGVIAYLNIHYAHSHDAHGQVIKEYRDDYLEFFEKLQVSPDNVIIVKTNN